jgi:hypothetical protein
MPSTAKGVVEKVHVAKGGTVSTALVSVKGEGALRRHVSSCGLDPPTAARSAPAAAAKHEHG